MVKKAVATLLVVLLLISIVPCAFAADSSTKRRGVFEFTELYMQRVGDYDHFFNDGEGVMILSQMPWPVHEGDETAHVATTAGTLEFDLSDFSLVSYTEVFYDYSNTKYENEQEVMQRTVAVSALEYSYAEDQAMKITADVMGGPKSAIDAANSIVTEILEKISEGALDSVRENVEKVLVYSGNYDYYISARSYTSGGVEHDIIELEAIAR